MPGVPAVPKNSAYTDHANADSVPTEINVSMVAAPCRRFVQAARWNGRPPQTTTGAARVSAASVVYVTLAAAPYVLRWNASQETLENQLGVAAGPIAAWWLDSSGALYAEIAAGPALVDDRESSRSVH